MKTLLMTTLAALMLASPALAAEDSKPAPDFIYSEAPDDHVLGADTAPTTMIVYASVTCPHCGSWFSDDWPEIKSKLVETGELRFVFREFPTQPQILAMTGFVINECAPDTETYMSAIEYQMQNQKKIFDLAKDGKGREAYDAVAKEAGLKDMAALEACFADRKHEDHIRINSERALAGKINGVPAFLINGDMYNGEQDADTLIKLITDMNKNGISKLPETAPRDPHKGHKH